MQRGFSRWLGCSQDTSRPAQVKAFSMLGAIVMVIGMSVRIRLIINGNQPPTKAPVRIGNRASYGRTGK